MFSRVLLAIVLMALFVPVPYFAGVPAATPSFLANMLAGVPLSIWTVVILLALYVVFTWALAASGSDSGKD